MTLKYKVGDKVRIKSLDWYNENKDEYGNIDISHDFTFYADRSKYCGKVFTIDVVFDNCYTVKEDNHEYYWADKMIEGLVEEEMSLDKAGQITDFEYEGLVYTLPEGYQFVDENGNVINATKIVLEKKKKEYPKTYGECCTVLRFHYDHYLTYDDENDINPIKEEEEFIDLMDTFSRLIVCRNAYWKIYGEKMGLGEPWKPNWLDDNAKYSIYTIKGMLTKAISCYDGAILTFPTEEMRDAFYENFKELIEQCKELL